MQRSQCMLEVSSIAIATAYKMPCGLPPRQTPISGELLESRVHVHIRTYSKSQWRIRLRPIPNDVNLWRNNTLVKIQLLIMNSSGRFSQAITIKDYLNTDGSKSSVQHSTMLLSWFLWALSRGLLTRQTKMPQSVGTFATKEFHSETAISLRVTDQNQTLAHICLSPFRPRSSW